MRKYLIMLTALLVAVLVMSLIKGWQRRRAIAAGKNPDALRGIGTAHIIGALAGLLVFFGCVLWLENSASGPDGAYRPAQIKDGKISAGGFEADGY